MIDQLKQRLHAKHSERVFLDAQRGLIERPRLSSRRVLGYALSLTILALPFGFFLLGAWMILFQSEHLFMIICGIFALIFAYIIHPRPVRRTAKEFDRTGMPELFRLMDAIAAEMGVKTPDAFASNYDFHDYATTYGLFKRRTLIGVGMPLWWLRGDAERIAVLAQQIAHFGNGDPKQDAIVGAAFETTLRWEHILTPPPDPDFHPGVGDLIAGGIMFVLRLPVRIIGEVLLYLEFGTGQRSVYIADAMAARVAGSDAVVSSIHKNAVEPVAVAAINALYPYDRDQNARVFDVMAAAVADLPDGQRMVLEQRAKAQVARIDQSSAPDGYRIAFVKTLGDVAPKLAPDMFDFNKIGDELRIEADRQGRMLMQRYEIQ